jgi:hypothetical protein
MKIFSGEIHGEYLIKTILMVLLAICSGNFKLMGLGIECLNHSDRLIKTDNISPEILYFGNWSEVKDSSCFKNGRHQSNLQFNNCVFTFKGTMVRWAGSKDYNHGLAEVYIDGIFQKTIDSYAKKSCLKQLLFEKNDLSSDRIHTLKIVVKKEKNAESTGYEQDVDYFESFEPVDYPAHLKASADSELKVVASGNKPYLVPNQWKPVSYKAKAPTDGVVLRSGVLNDCFIRNISYLNHCFANPYYCDGEGWYTGLPASNEGRMLQGAGNTLRWGERSDMREIVNTLVNKIGSRQRADGYSNYYPESDYSNTDILSITSERKNYDRVFWTRGLLDAGMAGNAKAYRVLRSYYDWFNHSPYLNQLLIGENSTNALPGGGLVCLSPIGKAEDLVVTERYLDQDYWITELKNENPLCITYYPPSRSHCYELLGLEAFIDEYRATGATKYLDAVKGGWKAYEENFQNVGGIPAISEAALYPPKSFYLDQKRHVGETCGGVFWINLNSRLLQLYPAEEKYAGEIEKVIYNVILACQDHRGYIRYTNFLQGTKDKADCSGTCCECSSVGLIAKLPEYIYSLADDGVYINLFAPSMINWKQGNEEMTLVTRTGFPENDQVSISVKCKSQKKMKIRIRIPSWADGKVKIEINKKGLVTGKPGTYATVDRTWKNDDVISFTLPLSFRLHKYTGLDQDKTYDRYALMAGPVLMALVGDTVLNTPASKLKEKLRPVSGSALHLYMDGEPTARFIPYYQVQQEHFTCFPTVEN